jgi:hypothetical protein
MGTSCGESRGPMWTCQGQSVHNLWAPISARNWTRWVTCKNVWIALWTKKMSSPADRFAA